jgi:hypothetical protein
MEKKGNPISQEGLTALIASGLSNGILKGNATTFTYEPRIRRFDTMLLWENAYFGLVSKQDLLDIRAKELGVSSKVFLEPEILALDMIINEAMHGDRGSLIKSGKKYTVSAGRRLEMEANPNKYQFLMPKKVATILKKKAALALT